MKSYKAMAHINSLHGEMDEITVITEKQLSLNQPGFIVDYKGVKCTAIYNWFSGSFYADDVYGRISE